MDATDVAVIGGGVAGLTCALALEEAGLDVRVLERTKRVGGRVGTDVIDGFRCDRGLQWLNTGHPDVRAMVDVAALNPRAIEPGMVLAHPQGYRILRGPQPALIASLRSGLGTPRDIARLLRWSEPLRSSPDRVLARADQTLAESLDRHGISGPIREEVLRPLFRLVFADEDLSTSYKFVMLGLRSLLAGTPTVPALGMQALPNQLAMNLDRAVRVGADVLGVRRDTGDGVAVQTGDGEVRARAAVVATDPATASSLLGLSIPAMRGLSTWWFATDVRPTSMKMPFVNPFGRAAGPLSHALVVSNVAPRYAPVDRHLVAGVVVPVPDGVVGVETEAEVRLHLAQLFQTDTTRWDVVTRSVHTAAWPVARPPLTLGRAHDLGDGLFVAGDHRETPSIPGAMRSGRRAAAAVLARLGQPVKD